MHARKLREFVTEQIVEMLDRSRIDANKVVAVPCGRVAFYDRGVGDCSFFEFRMGIEADANIGIAVDFQTKGGRIDLRSKPLDRALSLKFLHP